MISKKHDNNAMPPVSGKRLAGALAVALTLSYSVETMAQGPQFGIAPSARTQQAIGDSPTQSQRENEGLYAAVGIAYSHRKNVRRNSDLQGGGESDSAVVISPQAGYKRNIGRHSAEINVATQFTRFKDLTDEDTETYTVRGLTNLDVSRLVDVDLFASFTDAAEPRGGSGTRLIQDPEPDELHITRYGGNVTVGQRAGRIQVEVGADRSEWRYQNNQQEGRDRDNDSVHGRVYYNISPRTSVFAGVRHSDITFIRPGATNPDSKELGYEVGGRWDVTAKTTGQVSIGRTEKDFDDPARNDTEATTLAGRLSWTPRQRTTLSLYGSRQFEESTITTDDFFISELIGVSVNQSFGSRWNAFAYINQTDDEYDGGRRDEILDYGVGLDYSLRRWLSVGAQYSVIEKDSNVPGNDFNDEIVSLYLNGNFELSTR